MDLCSSKIAYCPQTLNRVKLFAFSETIFHMLLLGMLYLCGFNSWKARNAESRGARVLPRDALQSGKALPISCLRVHRARQVIQSR